MTAWSWGCIPVVARSLLWFPPLYSGEGRGEWHDFCDELGLRCHVDIIAGAARAWTNADDRKH